jgi:hypothetical protein
LENFLTEIYFEIFFLHNNYILGTYFLTIKRFWKAANKLGDFLAAFQNLSMF